MTTREKIKEALDRNEKAVSLRPAIGQVTITNRARQKGGVTFEMEEGNWTLTTDLHPKSGGDANGPDPSMMVRSAFSGCLAIGFCDVGGQTRHTAQ